ncbi:CD151 antigen-like [Aphidius gifuensis]|nr:CD151 antigen-like [Aphidius gifuensis]
MAAGIFIKTITVETSLEFYKIYLEKFYKKPVLFLLVGSVMLAAAGILGIISAVQNWKQGIIAFSLCIIYLLVSMIALGVTIFFLSKNSKNTMFQQLDQHMQNYSQHKEAIDNLQSNLPCCGINYYSDWINISGEIPGSCCESTNSCDETEINISELPSGCFGNLNKLLNYYGEILVIVLIVLGGIEIFTLLFSWLFIRSLNNQRRKKSIRFANNHINNSVELPRINNPLGKITITRPQRKLKLQKIPEPIFIKHSSEIPVSKRSSTSEVSKYQYLKRATLNNPKLKKINSHVEHFGI